MLDNQLKKQAKIRESALAGVVILAICYASFMTFYTPQKKLADELSATNAKMKIEIRDLENQNNILTQKFQHQNEEFDNKARLEADRDPRVQLMKNSKESKFKNVSDFLNVITQDKFRSSININGLKYDLPSQKEGYTEVKFFVNASGRFANIIDFTQKLETMQALITLDVINIEVNKKDANQVTLDLSGTFYQLAGNDNG